MFAGTDSLPSRLTVTDETRGLPGRDSPDVRVTGQSRRTRPWTTAKEIGCGEAGGDDASPLRIGLHRR